MEESEAAKRLMRLLIAGFRFSQKVDDTIWLDHPREENGRVIFYSDGQVSALDIRRDEFGYMELADQTLFDRFMTSVKPTRRRDRLRAWADDIIIWTVFVAMMGTLWLVLWWLQTVVRDWWRG